MLQWERKYYIDGSVNIDNVSNNGNLLFEVMVFELSQEILAQIMESTYQVTLGPLEKPLQQPTQQVFVPTSETTNAFPECKTYGSGTVKCIIEHAYCSYKPSVNGQPTFCNDAPPPNYTFTYVVWGQDVSYLDGHCIIIYGKIQDYNGKPQISWQNNEGFDGFCD